MTSAVASLLVSLFPLVFFGMVGGLMMVHHKYDELWRPLLGLFLWKRPLLRRHLDDVDLFRIGNQGKKVRTSKELNESYRRLVYALEQRSWFLAHDKRLLRDYYRSLHAHIIFQEEYERKRNSGQKKQNEYARQAAREKAEAQASWWRAVLKVSQSEKDPKVIKTAYRVQVSSDHPDKGGTGKKMPDLNKAIEAARKELNFV